MLERIGRVGAFRVEYSHCWRQNLIWHMVVADDEIYTLLFGIGNLLNGLDATVKYNDEFNSCFLGIVYSFVAYSVSFFFSVRDVIVDVGIKLHKKFIDECHCCASVHVIVTIHHDAFLASHCIVEPIYGHIHIVHQKRIDEFVHHRSEETFCCRFSFDASADKQICNNGTHVDFLGQFFNCLLPFWCRRFVIPLVVHLYIVLIFSLFQTLSALQ